jgi:putative transposase
VETHFAPAVENALMQRWEPIQRNQLHYLITWNTRGLRPVLKGRHIETIRGLVQMACDERGLDLVEVVVGTDHVHVLVGLKASQSVASVVRELKGRTSMELMLRHPELRVWLRGNLVWDERHAVETVSSSRLVAMRDRLLQTHREVFMSDTHDHEDWAAAS